MNMQQQQAGAMFPVMPSSFPPTNITTEQIQKYLDENKKLILAILDNQNLGKLAECAQYQAQLQKNLMYLAAIADAQPQTPAMPAQMSPNPAMLQGGGFYMQQPGIFPPRGPPFNSPHPLQDPLTTQGQMTPFGPGNNGGGGTSNSGLNDMLGVGVVSNNKQDKAGASSDAQPGGNSAVGDGEEAK